MDAGIRVAEQLDHGDSWGANMITKAKTLESGHHHPADSVLILGNYRPALRLASALHGLGRHVIVTRGCGGGYADLSRYVTETWDHPPLASEAAFFAALGKFLRSRPDIQVVVPLWERCVKSLEQHRHLLPGDRLYAAVDPEIVETCLDKSKMLVAADKTDVPNAPFLKVRTYEALWQAAIDIGYPQVVRPAGSQAAIAGKKTLIVENPGELAKALPAWPCDHQELIVQRYVDGPRINLYFAAQRGTPIRYLAAEILKTDERDGTGLAVDGRTIALDPVLKGYADRLLAHLDYHGVGTLQFLHDRKSSDYCFLELNPRIAGNHAVPEACGLGLGPLAIDLAAGIDQSESLIVGAHGRRYVWSYGAVAGLYRAVKSGEVGLHTALKSTFDLAWAAWDADIHMTWNWRDPLPTLAAFANHVPMLSNLVQRARGPKQRPGDGASSVTQSVYGAWR